MLHLPEEQQLTEPGQALSILDILVRVKQGLGTGVVTLRSLIGDENDLDEWDDDELLPLDAVEAKEVEQQLEESLQEQNRKKRTKNAHDPDVMNRPVERRTEEKQNNVSDTDSVKAE